MSFSSEFQIMQNRCLTEFVSSFSEIGRDAAYDYVCDLIEELDCDMHEVFDRVCLDALAVNTAHFYVDEPYNRIFEDWLGYFDHVTDASVPGFLDIEKKRRKARVDVWSI